MMRRSYALPTVPVGGATEVIANVAGAATLIDRDPVMELVVLSVAVMACVPLPTVSNEFQRGIQQDVLECIDAGVSGRPLDDFVA